eukprot:8702429-Lingulodinium_polyedra.AAC.1
MHVICATVSALRCPLKIMGRVLVNPVRTRTCTCTQGMSRACNTKVGHRPASTWQHNGVQGGPSQGATATAHMLGRARQ